MSLFDNFNVAGSAMNAQSLRLNLVASNMANANTLGFRAELLDQRPVTLKGMPDEARAMGAHEVIASNDDAALKRAAGRFDLIIVTVNATLPWKRYVAALAPRGRLHFVGAVLEPVPVTAFSLIGGQRSISGSPTGSPATIATMLDFCARHDIAAQTEHFPVDRVNDAIQHLRDGKARYRVVVDIGSAA